LKIVIYFALQTPYSSSFIQSMYVDFIIWTTNFRRTLLF